MTRLKQAVLAPKVESLFIAAVVLFGFRLGARPIGDNSMLTHLRTGVDMVAGRGIPRVDPYSYTASGEHWVVQSWLPEWTYGWAYRLGGHDFRLVVLEQALLIGGLAWLVVRLARAGSPLRTALAGICAVGVGSALWTPRPLLFGLLCMALTITVVERRRSPWLLVPIVWLWVNSHGSFPLGLLWLGARGVGEGLDWRAWPRATWGYIGGFVAGLVVSLVNPLGGRLLVFPLTLGKKAEAFRTIVEWRSPDFSRAGGHFALFFLGVSLVLLMRARLPWRDIVPVAGFFVASLLAARNIGPLGVVLAPALGRAFHRPDTAGPRAPRLEAGSVRVNRALLATLAATFVVFGALIFSEKPIDETGYPKAAATFLSDAGLLGPDHRLAHQDFVGNYLELRFGRQVKTFIDDRYDMYPLPVSNDYELLQSGKGDSTAILDRYRVDVVLWQPKLPLVPLLEAKGWQQAFADKDYVVLRRP